MNAKHVGTELQSPSLHHEDLERGQKNTQETKLKDTFHTEGEETKKLYMQTEKETETGVRLNLLEDEDPDPERLE